MPALRQRRKDQIERPKRAAIAFSPISSATAIGSHRPSITAIENTIRHLHNCRSRNLRGMLFLAPALARGCGNEEPPELCATRAKDRPMYTQMARHRKSRRHKR